MKNTVINMIFFPQLIPENFLTTPVFPYSPKSQNGNGNSQDSRNGEVLQRIIAKDCYYIIPKFSSTNSSENSSVSFVLTIFYFIFLIFRNYFIKENYFFRF